MAEATAGPASLGAGLLLRRSRGGGRPAVLRRPRVAKCPAVAASPPRGIAGFGSRRGPRNRLVCAGERRLGGHGPRAGSEFHRGGRRDPPIGGRHGDADRRGGRMGGAAAVSRCPFRRGPCPAGAASRPGSGSPVRRGVPRAEARGDFSGDPGARHQPRTGSGCVLGLPSPAFSLWGGNAYTLERYLSALRKAGFKIRRVLSPWESDVNLFPQTFRDARNNVARRLGFPFPRLLPAWIVRRRSRRLETPGRLYAFVGVKP